MDRKIAGWPTLVPDQSVPSVEDVFAQEDTETRTIVHRYLHLADKLLSQDPLQAWAEEENQAA